MSWSIQQVRDVMQGASLNVEGYLKNAKEWDPVMAVIKDKVGHCSGSDWGGLFIYLTGTVKQLADVWNDLRNLGYKTDYSEIKTEDAHERKVIFTKTVEGIIVATATIHFSSSVCKRVQVGTELREVPVYEIKCDEPEPEVKEEAMPGEVPPRKTDGHTEDPIPF